MSLNILELSFIYISCVGNSNYHAGMLSVTYIYNIYIQYFTSNIFISTFFMWSVFYHSIRLNKDDRIYRHRGGAAKSLGPIFKNIVSDTS